jgi:hypothetical protein
MQLIELNWRPDDRIVRQFGACTAIALPLLAWWTTTDTQVWSGLFGGSAWDAGNLPAIGIAALVGGVILILSLTSPALIRPLYVAASLLALPIGLVVSQLLIVVLYYGIFLPVGLVFRLIGRDVLDRRFDREAASYWLPKAQAASVESYFRQS